MVGASGKSGSLFIVATPIGNLEDFSPRAQQVLSTVDLILAEDTRHSAKLLRHFGVSTPMESLHEHNERQKLPGLLQRLQRGENLALICDAGTPLISDPGYPLVTAVHGDKIPVLAVPGPNAAVAALSISGLATARFVFEGFLPAKTAARCSRLQALGDETRTLVFYESSHRIVDSLRDMVVTLGADRRATVARELTKRYETVRQDSLDNLLAWVTQDPDQQRGEFVVLVEGVSERDGQQISAEDERVLRCLLDELPHKQAVSLASKITGTNKNALYRQSLKDKDEGHLD